MLKKIIYPFFVITYIGISLTSCGLPKLTTKTENKTVPEGFNKTSQDTTNSGQIDWKTFFTDPNLNALIDTALKNNQELNITMQEIVVAQSEVRAKKGEYLPFANFGAGAGIDKVGRYTRNGAVEANNDIAPSTEFPEPLSDLMFGAYASWEVDIWKKLRNGKKAAAFRYLSSIEGRNFLATNLVAEIANSYYELLALDNQLDIINQNITIQLKALEIVKQQKQAAKVTELPVKKFEAEVLKNQSLQYYIKQQIIETENKINFLVGRYPQPIQRDYTLFTSLVPDSIYGGIPSKLLENRPDIKQAELNLMASKLDVKIAKANFYPSFGITAGVGYQAFNAAHFIKTPESLLYTLAGDLVTPLINRNAIKATYISANAKQTQAVYNYERTILNAYTEVYNQLSKIDNLKQSFELKQKQVEVLTQSTSIAANLFKSARADYMEVLMTQRDALEAKIELIETKKDQMNAMVNVYRALGGGWK